jgi:hypothetical protein
MPPRLPRKLAVCHVIPPSHRRIGPKPHRSSGLIKRSRLPPKSGATDGVRLPALAACCQRRTTIASATPSISAGTAGEPQLGVHLDSVVSRVEPSGTSRSLITMVYSGETRTSVSNERASRTLAAVTAVLRPA